MFDISGIRIPAGPGIYLMKGADGAVIYIGKAKNLQRRVRSYFLKNQNYKTQKLVQKISDIEFVLTDNESEAFLLESNMIKKYRPRFNIELKDQQRYTYLRISDEKYPRLMVARRTRDGRFLGRGKIYGPFTQGSSKLLTIGTLRKAFQVRICKTLPKKVCLEYHLGNCEGPCEFEGAQGRYAQNIESLQDVLKGREQGRVFAQKLEDQMRQAAQLEQFERAKDIRDTLSRLGSLKTRQKVEYVKNSNEEYFGMSVKEHSAIVMNFKMIHGVIRDSDKFFFDLVGDNSFENFLYQYYTTSQVPRLIVVSQMPRNYKLLESLFSAQAGSPVRITLPTRGKRREMMDLIMKNIALVYAQGADPGLVDLRDVLGLPGIPDVIECFDISNHGDDYAVGSMVQFVGGRPNKAAYRRYKIKTVKGRDDYSMIAEIVRRRYVAAAAPDLVVIDGGKGQLGAAVRALAGLGLKIPCVSLAKKEEEIHVPRKKNPVKLSRSRHALQILQHARDEAHRFGISYNRGLRKIK